METLTAMLDSLRPADSARSAETTQHRRPTSKDILAGGYNCQREIPEPVECEFCGRKLYHEALVMGRTVLMFAPFPQRCTCDRAKAKWAEADAEEARQKAEAEKEAAQAKRRAKIERLLGRSGIKKRFQQRTFANFIRDTPERQRCYDTAKTYADSFPQRAERGEGLYIEGTYGTGKTHLAAAIALQLIRCPGSGCCYRRQPVSGLERCGQTSRTKGRTLWTVYRADSLGKGDAKGRCSKRKNK